MKITIEYEASWRNSFLDGNNNEKLPSKGRKFIGSMKSLGKAENFIQRNISLDTVMGILNRLIGRIYTYETHELFMDIGTPETYKKANS